MIWSCCLPETELALLPGMPAIDTAQMRGVFFLISLIAGIVYQLRTTLPTTFNFIAYSINKPGERLVPVRYNYCITVFDKPVSH